MLQLTLLTKILTTFRKFFRTHLRKNVSIIQLKIRAAQYISLCVVLTGDVDDVILELCSIGLAVVTSRLAPLRLCRTLLNTSKLLNLPDLVRNELPDCSRQQIIVNMIENIADLVHLVSGKVVTDLMVGETAMTDIAITGIC